MSREDIEVIQRGYDAWNRGDLEGVRAIYAPHITANAGALWPAAGEVHGPDAIIDAFASIFASFERTELVPEEFIERDEAIFVPTCWRGTLPDSDSAIEQRLIAVYTVRDGQVDSIRYFHGMDEAIGAVRAAEGQRSG
jgi:ketosteroid isomerase-like protein